MRALTNLTQPGHDLDGSPLLDEHQRPITPASIMSSALARGNAGDPIKAIDLGLQLLHVNGKQFVVDDADFDMLVEAVTNDKFLTNLGKAIALRCLNAAETIGPTELNRAARRKMQKELGE